MMIKVVLTRSTQPQDPKNEERQPQTTLVFGCVASWPQKQHTAHIFCGIPLPLPCPSNGDMRFLAHIFAKRLRITADAFVSFFYFFLFRVPTNLPHVLFSHNFFCCLSFFIYVYAPHLPGTTSNWVNHLKRMFILQRVNFFAFNYFKICWCFFGTTIN